MKTQILNALTGWILFPFSWSKWVDIQTFSFVGNAYLLQGKVNTVSNAKKFRVVKTNPSKFYAANIGILKMEDLATAGLLTTEVQYFTQT